MMAAEFSLRALDYPPSSFSPWVRDADTAYRYASNLRTRMSRPPEYDVAFATNSVGLRDDEIGTKSGPRVLLIGDSFTSGYGVERSQTVASLLEKRLEVDVVNAGVGGYELVHQVHYFESRGYELDADLVVLLLYLGNDLSRNGEWRETEDGGLASLTRTYPTRASAEFKLTKLYKQMRYSQRLDQAARAPWQPFDDYLALCERELGKEAQSAYESSRQHLGRLRDAVEASGAEFLVAMFSYRTTVEPQALADLEAEVRGFSERYDLDLPAREIDAYLSGAEIEHLDLVPDLRRRYADRGELLYFPVDGHFTEEGNLAVAELLEAPLRSRLQ
jgi:hypothetical protein